MYKPMSINIARPRRLQHLAYLGKSYEAKKIGLLHQRPSQTATDLATAIAKIFDFF